MIIDVSAIVLISSSTDIQSTPRRLYIVKWEGDCILYRSQPNSRGDKASWEGKACDGTGSYGFKQTRMTTPQVRIEFGVNHGQQISALCLIAGG